MMKQKRYSRTTIAILLIAITFLTMMTTQVTANASTNLPYLIKVNKQANCVTIYEKDKDGKYTVPVKAMVCSAGTATPTGTYNTKIRYRWKVLLDNVWGQYATRIVDGILFHSVWYYRKDPSTLSATQYNKLGTTCSHGCVRLTVEDSKWIYDNCPIGTTVVIYNSSDPGPLGKPSAQKLAAGTGWDPTDPDPKNPTTVIETPTITGAKNQTVDWGSKIDLLKGVTAKSGTGESLTSSIKTSGKVDTSKAGTYKVTYSVKDANGTLTSVSIKYTVKEAPKELYFRGVGKRIISDTTKVTRSLCLKGVTAYFGTKKLSKDDIEVTFRKIDVGYRVKYSIEQEGKSIEKTVKFYVDKEAPELNVEHRVYSTKMSLTRDFLLEGVTVSDDYSDVSLDDIKITKEKVNDYAQLVTYTVSDDYGHTTTETVQFTRTNSLVINGVKNRSVSKKYVIDEAYVMEGVTGTNGDKDVTKDIKVTISEPKDNVYTVTYELKNSYGVYTKIISFFTVQK